MDILVTGGAGYKGVLLVEKLLEWGNKVTILDNFMYGYDSVLHMIGNPNLHVISMDIRNLRGLGEWDVVYHLAGISGMPACASNPSAAQAINVEATRQLSGCLGKSQILIYASTTSIYGGANGAVCDEDTPIQAGSLYAKTKYEAEKIVQERENSISLRFATVFGVSTRQRNDLLVNDFTYRSLNERSIVLFDSRSRRTFVHISDAINGYLFALDHAEEMCGRVFNVGDESMNFSKMDIASEIRSHVKCDIIDSTLPDLDVRNFLVSFSRMRNLGFKTKLTLDDGIRDLLKLYGFYKYHSHFNVI